ncbi:C-type mannose receptor 2-like, partial [Astyanax mexicanus]
LFVIYSKCLLLTGLLALSSCLSRQYYFVNQTKQWTDAQTYCRQIYTDLATLDNANDQNSVLAAVNNSGYTGNGQIWIGQYEDVQNSWRWFLDDDAFYGVGEKNYRNWGTNAPNNNGGEEIQFFLYITDTPTTSTTSGKSLKSIIVGLYCGKWPKWFKLWLY